MTLTLWQAYDRWCGLAGPLANFVAPSPFLAAWEPVPQAPRHRAARTLAEELADKAGSDAGVILEAPARVSLAVASELLARGAGVAPAFFRWPHPHAVRPSGPLTSWLLGIAQGGSGPDSARPAGSDSRAGSGAPPCLLLDGERGGTVSARTLRTRFDNRFTYGSYQLPPAKRWRALGVTRLVWAAPAAGVSPDLEEYADALVSGGLTLELVALSALAPRSIRP